MLKILFLGMLEVSTSYYGDSIGLAPISLGAREIDQLKSTDNDADPTFKD